MVADRRNLCAQTFIAGIAAKVENDWQGTLSGSWGDDQTVSPTLNKDIKLSEVGKMMAPTKGQGNEEGANLDS